jgi:hypothetical protein
LRLLLDYMAFTLLLLRSICDVDLHDNNFVEEESCSLSIPKQSLYFHIDLAPPQCNTDGFSTVVSRFRPILMCSHSREVRQRIQVPGNQPPRHAVLIVCVFSTKLVFVLSQMKTVKRTDGPFCIRS